jgi:hypothetical protein
MLSLSNTLSHSAGLCGADELNARGRWIEKHRRVPSYDCKQYENIIRGTYSETWQWIQEQISESVYDTFCLHILRFWEVDPNPPSYCIELWNHENTYFVDGPRFVTGTNPWDGHWIEPAKK